MTVEAPRVGGTYRMTGEVKALCCTGALRPGEIVTVTEQTSKNRLLVKPKKQGSHKVKRSAFRLNVEEVEVGE